MTRPAEETHATSEDHAASRREKRARNPRGSMNGRHPTTKVVYMSRALYTPQCTAATRARHDRETSAVVVAFSSSSSSSSHEPICCRCCSPSPSPRRAAGALGTFASPSDSPYSSATSLLQVSSSRRPSYVCCPWSRHPQA